MSQHHPLCPGSGRSLFDYVVNCTCANFVIADPIKATELSPEDIAEAEQLLRAEFVKRMEATGVGPYGNLITKPRDEDLLRSNVQDLPMTPAPNMDEVEVMIRAAWQAGFERGIGTFSALSEDAYVSKAMSEKRST